MSNKKENISFKDLLRYIKGWFAFLKSKWLIIVSLSLIAGVGGFVYAWLQKPAYPAEITFVLSSGNQTGGALTSLAGQLGYNIGNNESDIFAGDNIVELFKSKRIINGALFRKLPDSTTLLSAFIKENNFDITWPKQPGLKNVLPFPDNEKQTTLLQDSLLTEIHDLITKKYLQIDKPDKKLAIYSLRISSTDKTISYYLARYILNEASKFYIDTKTKTAKLNLDMLQHEADSLSALLGTSITNTAEAIDQTYNINPAYQVQRTPAQRSQVKVTIQSTAYAEVVRNLELAKITLQKETPLYQEIDEPSKLLKMKKISRLLTAIIFSFLTGFSTCLFLVMKRSYKMLE